MISDFENILNKLGENIDIDLTPESNGCCSISIDEKLIIQIELDKNEEDILIISPITELPPGTFRTNVFANTLKANNQMPKIGTFAFNESSLELLLFEYFPLKTLNEEILKNIIDEFSEKAISWKDALNNNESAPIDFIKQLNATDSLLNEKFIK